MNTPITVFEVTFRVTCSDDLTDSDIRDIAVAMRSAIIRQRNEVGLSPDSYPGIVRYVVIDSITMPINQDRSPTS